MKIYLFLVKIKYNPVLAWLRSAGLEALDPRRETCPRQKPHLPRRASGLHGIVSLVWTCAASTVHATRPRPRGRGPPGTVHVNSKPLCARSPARTRGFRRHSDTQISLPQNATPPSSSACTYEQDAQRHLLQQAPIFWKYN